jgi:hypothetical protein
MSKTTRREQKEEAQVWERPYKGPVQRKIYSRESKSLVIRENHLPSKFEEETSMTCPWRNLLPCSCC